MELPHGVLVRSFKGPIPLAELNAALLKDSFTGFMRASLLKGTITEGVIIYSNGKPIIAFTSDARTDHPDSEQKAITLAAANDDSVIELFALNESQLRLAVDLSKDFLIKQPYPPPSIKPAAEAPRPMPVQRPKVEKPLSFPEVRGMFTKSESIGSLRSYIETRKDETGHMVLTGQDGAGYAEYHLLFLKGKAVAAYSTSSREAGAAFLNSILPMGGVAEFYSLDEAIIHSILKMYPHVVVPCENPPESIKLMGPVKEPVKTEPRPMHVLRPDSKPFIPLQLKPEPKAEASVHSPEAPKPVGPMETHRYDSISRQGIGVPAKSLFDKRERPGAEGMGMSAPESKSTGMLKGEIDDDADFVKKVEKEFVGNVDDLLKRLELSHLKVLPDKKKRL